MRNIIFKPILFIIILTLYSCTKCANCTRTWTYITYQIGNSGNYYTAGTTTGSTEKFDVCGSTEINNAEKTITTHTQLNSTSYVDGSGKCNCTTQ